MRPHVGCRAGQRGNKTHDLFVLVLLHCARRFLERPNYVYVDCQSPSLKSMDI